jgi:GGDEF domain-containing protein
MLKGTDTMTTQIMNKEFFLNTLDLEIKRAMRYRDFFSILKLKLAPLPGSENSDEARTCWQTMREFLAAELRESDILSFFGDDQWAVIIPYADLPAVGRLRSRLLESLQYCDFEKKGYKVSTDVISFPIDGTNTADLLGKL